MKILQFSTCHLRQSVPLELEEKSKILWIEKKDKKKLYFFCKENPNLSIPKRDKEREANLISSQLNFSKDLDFFQFSFWAEAKMAAASTSMAAAAAVATVLTPRFTLRSTNNCAALPYLRPLSTPFSQLSSESRRTSLPQLKASEESSASVDTNELFSDIKEKWEAVENKSTVILYGGGAVVGVWLASILVGAINSVPLLPKIMELVGLGYTGWFVYRYLLFKSSRKELASDIEALKKKIAGTE